MIDNIYDIFIFFAYFLNLHITLYFDNKNTTKDNICNLKKIYGKKSCEKKIKIYVNKNKFVIFEII